MLNNWVGTDKPTRSDFVRDNILIDTAIWQHTADAYAHLSNSEKTRVSDPYVTSVYQGTDAAHNTITFDFTPKLVICFAAELPPVSVDNGVTTVRFGVAVNGIGSSGGCALGTSGLIVDQGQTGDLKYDLNNSDNQYIVIAFR